MDVKTTEGLGKYELIVLRKPLTLASRTYFPKGAVSRKLHLIKIQMVGTGTKLHEWNIKITSQTI